MCTVTRHDLRNMKTFLFCLSVILEAAWSQPNVQIPPSITVQPEKEYIYRDDGVVTLPCKLTGEPQPTYEWMKNGEILNLNGDNINLTPDPTDGTITIHPCSIFDQGYYQCIASNQHGKSLSSVAFLQKAVLGGYSPADPRIYSAKEGSSLMVQCEGIISVPKATFSWALVTSTTDKNPIPLQTSRRVQIDETGNLYFFHVTKEDAQDGKLYKCNVFNAYLDITIGGSYSEIRVEPDPDVGNIEPTLMHVTPAPVIALLGEPFHIKCLFAGKNEPRVTWGRIGSVLPAGRTNRNHFETELEVTGTMFVDEGKYTCQGIGSSTSDVTNIYVDVQSQPKFTHRPTNVNATEKESQKFECRADAEPSVSIDWLKNGELLDSSKPGDRMEISPDGYTLTISDLCKDCDGGGSDLMVIQCNASNVHGYVFADGYLNVLKPTIFTKVPANVSLEGDQEHLEEVRFECEAVSDESTPVYYTWYFRGKEIIFENEKDLTLDGHDVVVNLKNKTVDEKGEHGGTYKCVATNTYSEVSASANLEVPAAANPKPIVGAGIGDLWWVFLIIAIILLLLILLLCCRVCIQRNKGDTYPIDEKERAHGNDPEKELLDTGFHDYQRPEEEPSKALNASLNSLDTFDSEDEGSLNEYGDDVGKFSEDGSFLGQYATNDRKRYLRF